MTKNKKFKILTLGLDSSILDKDSALAKRAREYGGLVEKYFVIAPADKQAKISLAPNVKAYGVKTRFKIDGFFGVYNLAKKLLKNSNFNIISVQDAYYLALAGYILSRKFKIGLEIQIHGFEKFHGIRKKIAQFVIPRATAIRAVSQRLKKELVRDFGVAEERITVVPIYSDAKCQIPNTRYQSKDKFIFLTVGRLVEVKNIALQIKAMKNIVSRIKGQKIELWIVGDGPLIANYELLIKNLGVKENVKLLGHQKDLAEFYLKANAFLLTSNYEGWGLAAIEAASYGLPIIMTDVGCAGEVIKNNKSGIVIQKGDQRALEVSMLFLIRDQKLRDKLGKGAREAVQKLPKKEEILDGYLEGWGRVKS